MSDRFQRSRRLALTALAGLLLAGGVQAQGFWRNRGGGAYGEPPPRGGEYRQQFGGPPPRGRDYGPPSGEPLPRGRDYRPPPRQFDDPDRAANAAREATGGRVLGVQGADRDGQPGYRVRILQPDGRVRNFHYDPGSGRMRD